VVAHDLFQEFGGLGVEVRPGRRLDWPAPHGLITRRPVQPRRAQR
jgi:hypothetical protein